MTITQTYELNPHQVEEMIFEEVPATENLSLALEPKSNLDKWVKEHSWGATLDFCHDSDGMRVLRISGTREVVEKAKIQVKELEDLETVDQA